MMTDRILYRSHLICALAGALGGAALSGTPALAAQTVKATVDAKGTLRFSKATLKALGVRTKDGMVAVELPLPPRAIKRSVPPKVPAAPGAPHAHAEPVLYEGPPRLFVSLRRDGSLEIRRQKLPPRGTVIPGAPGTTFLATADKGKLILARPK